MTSEASSQAPPKPTRFALFAAPVRRLVTNLVDCNVTSESELCGFGGIFDGFSGGFWPRGTHNYHIFSSGIQFAGIIGPDGGPWAGDTTGAFFFDLRGTSQHGTGFRDVSYFLNPDDRADWPPAARVTDPVYHPTLQGLESVSEGDAWWMSWEGLPWLNQGRLHPLGIAVEGRALAWNYPVGNEDVLFFVFRIFNITSLNPADYLGISADLRPVLLEAAQRFHQSQDSLGITLPAGGYTIRELYPAVAADMDVGDAGVNFASVALPLRTGFSWDHAFSPLQGWTFDPRIFSSPFFAGVGIAGIRILSDSLQMFTGGGGNFTGTAPRDVIQLWRYLSGNHDPQAGDDPCNFDPQTDHICFIRNTSASDVRQVQSAGFLNLAPGASATFALAYLFAAPVRVGGTKSCPACDIKPGNPAIIAGLRDPAVVAAGVNTIDSIAGFLGASDLSGDGVLQGDEFITVPRSLYNKAQIAQAIFDNQFLLPSAPAAPDFFLIPGDTAVTVMWRPSPTEQTGDPFFTIAQDAQVLNGRGVLVPNPLYDPNFRQFDVEGYRIYRSRVNDPAAMTLIAQFDYAGTVISDYAGLVNPTRFCAPELGISTDCPVAFDPVQSGQARSAHVDVPLAGDIVQTRLGDRIALPDSTVLVLQADTVGFTSAGFGLYDGGVPFVYVDQGVRNNFRYYYTVVAFDLNSLHSGPSSFESARVLKSVTPVRHASNYVNTAGGPRVEVVGRGQALPIGPLPNLDSTSGTFSGPMPPSNGWAVNLMAFVKEVMAGPVSFSVRLDSMTLGSAYDQVSNQYWATVMTPTDTTVFQFPILQDQFNTERHTGQRFAALTIDGALASRYGGNGAYTLEAEFDATLEGNYYTAAYGRGCVNGASGFSGSGGCDYNGARWFDGPSPARNEMTAHPNACATQNFAGTNAVTCYHNAGYLSGVANIFEQKAYQTTPNVWRNVEGVLGGAVRGADYNLYWGSGGSIDSVVDVSNNVLVPFRPDLQSGASWGVLNQTAALPSAGSYDQRDQLTVTDIGCVAGAFKTYLVPAAQLGCLAGPTYLLSPFVVPGPIVHWSGVTTNARVGCAPGVAGCGFVAPNPGFVLYMPGHLFLLELAGGQVPPAGTVWSMRDYVGAIRGGGGCADCLAGSDGPYIFTPQTRTFAAVGAELRVSYDVVNQVNAPTNQDLSRVHTVPDPYYLANEFEADAGQQVIKFVNLPEDAVIRIYSSSGVLVTLLEHHTTTFGGTLDWNVRNRSGRRVASGVYFYHIEAGNARRVGRFTIINNQPGF